MNLERMKQAAIEHSKENDVFAVVATDGDFEFARTLDEALNILDEMADMRERLAPERHDYAIVRVDV
jgi:hypothetical protein